MKNKTISIIRTYKPKELSTINYILGKKKENKAFTEFELKLINTIDLSNKKVVEVCKCIYEKEYNKEG